MTINELAKSEWTKKDGEEFTKLLATFGRPEKVEWTRRIINTNMPVLAVLSQDVGALVKGVTKGNFLSFLDLNLNEYYENTAVNASLISRIKDFETAKKYLLVLADGADNWATCDTVKFNVTATSAEDWWGLSGEMLSSNKEFVRRIGVDIMFQFILPYKKDYLDGVFMRLDALDGEDAYYVNMAAAWLLAECFAKRRDETLAYYAVTKTNSFVVNKSVQKCRDSFRVSAEDKDLLLGFKRK